MSERNRIAFVFMLAALLVSIHSSFAEDAPVVAEPAAELQFVDVPGESAPADDAPAGEKPVPKDSDKPNAEKPVEEKSDSEEKLEETAKFEIHHWGVWLADPALGTINSRESFTAGLPLSVETSRPRRLKGGDKKTTIFPTNVVTFRGQAVPKLEVELRVQSGSFLGHWPSGKTKNNRLRWLDYQLAATTTDSVSWATAPSEHWFTKAREDTDVLTMRKGSRAEKFLTYDIEASIPLPLKLEGGPDTFKLRSMANYPLHDIVIVAPSENGRRVGWLDLLPAAHEKKAAGGKSTPAATLATAPATVAPQPVAVAAGAVAPVAVVTPNATKPNPPASTTPEGQPGPPLEVTLSAPMKSDSPEWAAQTKTKLIERLTQTGLTQSEIDVLLSIYESAIFSSNSLTVTWRLPSGIVDEFNAIILEPEPVKTTRVVLVIARNLDPKITADLQQFVDQLGSPDYKQRESAEQRLSDLGSLAFPALKKALTHADPEVMFRAERLLLEQQQSIDVPK